MLSPGSINPAKTEKKFTEKKRKLSLYPKDKLPQYVQNHESKFKDWLD